MPDSVIVLRRRLSLLVLQTARSPADIVAQTVNEAWSHFAPVAELTTLRIYRDGGELVFEMELS